MDYLVFFANDVEKISIPGKKKRKFLPSTTRTEKSAVRILRIPARKAHSEIFKINLQDKYPQGPYRYLHTFP